MLESLFNKFAGPQACSSIKNELQHRCFPVKFEKCLRTPPVAFSEEFRTNTLVCAVLFMTSF